MANVKPFIENYRLQNKFYNTEISISQIFCTTSRYISSRIRSLPKWYTPCPDMIMVNSDTKIALEELSDKLPFILKFFIYLISFNCFFDWFYKKDDHLKQISYSDNSKEIFFLAVPDCTPLHILIGNHSCYHLPYSWFMIQYHYLNNNKNFE